MNNKKYGIALAGGGTKGSYEIGAFMAIKELGIEIDTAVGTSIGAINGAFIAQNDLDTAIELWHNLHKNSQIFLPKGIDSDNKLTLNEVPRLAHKLISSGGIDMAPLRKLLTDNLDEKTIRASEINFGLCTYNISDLVGKQFFLNDMKPGMLIDYILASACFPGFRPVDIEHELYIDGGVFNNFPVNLLKRAGCKNIIAVNLKPEAVEKRYIVQFNEIVQVIPKMKLGSTFDFSEAVLLRNFDMGWYDTLHAFGRFKGSFYHFAPDDYDTFVRKNGIAMLNSLEYGGQIIGIDPVRYISCEQLKEEVLKAFKIAMSQHKYESEGFFDMLKSLVVGISGDIEPSLEMLLNLCELSNMSGNLMHKELAKIAFAREYKTAIQLCYLLRKD